MTARPLSSITSITGHVNFVADSDARFKTDVKENVPGLSFITKLRPVTFRWDSEKLNAFAGKKEPPMSVVEGADDQKRFTGFLAQEVDAAARQCEFDFSGVSKPVSEDRDLYKLGYAEFVVPLVRVVQEQQKEIEELRGAVAALKSGGARPANQHAGMLGSSSGGTALLCVLAALACLRRSKDSGASS